MKRRLLSVLAVAALGASVLIGSAPASAEVSQGAAYVALGDSEAAGTGNLPYVDDECLRSKKSYPMLLADGYGGVDSQACAGADTAAVLDQAWAADLGPMTQLVTVTVGVNNIEWQELLVVCSSAGDPLACQAAYQAAITAVGTIPGGVTEILSVVRMRAPNAVIAVTGYPLLFGNSFRPCRVGAYEGKPVTFTFDQQVAVNDGIWAVNGAVAGAVAAFGDAAVVYVDVTRAFLSHRLCDIAGDRWISGLVSGDPVDDRSFHANSAGQRAYADILGGAVAP